ncbi:uncharacterized protein PHACADRAFT_214551, partial [Phanerochaete carnosa HHB-10118-sp]
MSSSSLINSGPGGSVKACRTTMQTWNTDIVWEVAAKLGQRDLANVARVCKQWLPIVRPHLYRDIVVDPYLRGTHALVALFNKREDLRCLVRHLTLRGIVGGEGWFKLLLEWIKYLPERNLVSVEIDFSDTRPLIMLLESPAIRTAPHVVIRQPVFNRERMAIVLANPHLRTLSAIVHSDCLAPQGTLRLKRLSITVERIPSTLPQILSAIEPSAPLQRFDLRVTAQPDEHVIAALARSLAPHAPSLTRLAIASGERVADAPFMDDLAPSLSSVEWLCCAYGTYTSALLLRAPARLHTLVLLWGLDGTALIRDPYGRGYITGPRLENVPFPSNDFARAVACVAARPEVALRRLVVALPKLVRDPCEAVAAACAAAGIAFEKVWMNDGMLDIME